MMDEDLILEVALRKESVDRNATSLMVYLALIRVALRKESVDRNIRVNKTQSPPSMSLSARRAWIEILNGQDIRKIILVALRKESVDRNTKIFEKA